LIPVTRLDGTQLLVNDDQITTIELAGETVIALANGDRLRVLESPDEIANRIVRWRRRTAPGDLLALDPAEAVAPALASAPSSRDRGRSASGV
jgi:flagellar protein FlbD